MDHVDHRAFMLLALAKATNSPDPSTQNGVLLVNQGSPVSGTFACNEFPRGVAYTDDRWERPLKYSVIEHAERNAIYAAARRGIATRGLSMVAVWAACADCARAIIQAGITELVTIEPAEVDANGRWGGSIDIGLVMLEEAGVKVTYLPVSDFPDAPTLRRDGNPWPPC